VRREEIRLETEPPPEGHIEHVEDVERSAESSQRACATACGGFDSPHPGAGREDRT